MCVSVCVCVCVCVCAIPTAYPKLTAGTSVMLRYVIGDAMVQKFGEGKSPLLRTPLLMSKPLH